MLVALATLQGAGLASLETGAETCCSGEVASPEHAECGSEDEDCGANCVDCVCCVRLSSMQHVNVSDVPAGAPLRHERTPVAMPSFEAGDEILHVPIASA